MKFAAVLSFVSFMVLAKSSNLCSSNSQCGGDACCTWTGTQNQWNRTTQGSCIPKNDTDCYCGGPIIDIETCPCPRITICLLRGIFIDLKLPILCGIALIG
uniref:U99-Liphistoxin-Lth1a_1 n=1 Tax=Liphistius thaleban TaxID=1905330 RepID=A0A4Q8K3P0_9ARAC